jgi:hypothetical protein
VTEFKPATPTVVTPEAPALHPVHGPAPTEGPPPPGAPHAPHFAVRKVVTSRPGIIGAPSTSPPPHVNGPKPAALPQAKREYAWQKNRALGKRF